METINYTSYHTMSEPEKVELFDGGVSISMFESAKLKRKFLQEVVENNGNNFLRKKALESLALMCIFGETKNSNTALSVLLDIEEDDDPFVLITKIKFLYLLNEKLELDDENIINQVSAFRLHENSDVAAESYYYTGLNEFIKANTAVSRLDYFSKIRSAYDCFKAADYVSENRLDAKLLMEICDLVCLSESSDNNLKTICLSRIKSLLVERKLSCVYHGIPDFELWIYRVVSKIYDIVCCKSCEWLDIKDELNTICCLHYTVTDMELLGDRSSLKNKITGSLSEFILEPFYKKSLNQYLFAIKRLSREIQDKENLSQFCNFLINIIENEGSKKKSDIDLDVVIQIAGIFPQIDTEKLKIDIQGIDLKDSTAVTRLIGSYISQYSNHPTSATGTPVGDEIFSSLTKKLQVLVPDYARIKFIEFEMVLSDVIRYTVLASAQKSSGAGFFKFLFDKGAMESDLQDSMCVYLEMNSDVGSRYKKEVTEVADGGRVDILYKSNNITIPIELKKTDLKPTVTSIAENYLGQAQTYCYPYDRLGLFVLLDNSCKGDELYSPINDIRELFDIQHMKPYYDLDNKYPDYIVTVIVPGNKMTPSSRSTYK